MANYDAGTLLKMIHDRLANIEKYLAPPTQDYPINFTNIVGGAPLVVPGLSSNGVFIIPLDFTIVEGNLQYGIVDIWIGDQPVGQPYATFAANGAPGHSLSKLWPKGTRVYIGANAQATSNNTTGTLRFIEK